MRTNGSGMRRRDRLRLQTQFIAFGDLLKILVTQPVLRILSFGFLPLGAGNRPSFGLACQLQPFGRTDARKGKER